ncbi:MAG: hypothetical protein HY275_10010 [Gemmatimonadetes bacterium]|nr:hypothetical protein [Gemmatimonadota bacterium]
MRATSLLLVTALVVAPATASAQYGGSYGRPPGSRTSPNGLPEAESMERRAPDAGPKSEELVDVKPLLKGIKLQPAQDSALRAIRDRYDPQLLPMYDWLRDQMVRKQKGQDVDMALVQKRFDRVDALRKKEVDEIAALLSGDQLVRFQKNADEQREADRENVARQEAMRERERQRQRPPR